MRLFQLIAIALLIYYLIKLLKRLLTKVQIKETETARKRENPIINVNEAEDAEFEEVERKDKNGNDQK